MQTLNDLLFRVREISAGRSRLLSVRLGGRKETLSASDFVGGVHSLALALEEQGLRRGERVALFAENRPEWHIVDFACHLLGLVTVPLYPTLPAQQVAYILRNSGSRWIFYSDAPKRDLLLALEPGLVTPPRAVAFDGKAAVPGGISLTRLMGRGAQRRGDVPVERFRGRVAPGDLASIVYTSGTTGDPKGVMLSHGNLVADMLGCSEEFEVGPGDVALSLLPLAHVFQRTVDYLCFYQGVAIHYVPAIERVASALEAVRPTVFTAVPRLYERVHQQALARVAKESPLRRRLFARALEVGRRRAAGRGRGPRPWLAFEHWLARRWVLGSLAERFGGRLRLPISGGAPLGREVAELFAAAGLPIYEGYGLTESAPVLTANSPRHWRLGSVGKPILGVELRLAADGEVLARGPNIMLGYWENPRATEEALGPEGWLATGDFGRIDSEGYLFLTGRKKDLLVTSGGKNITPQPIELRLAASLLLEQAVLLGDGRPHVAALLVPAFDALATAAGALTLSPAELVALPAARKLVETHVREVNTTLAEHERIRRWALLPRPLTLEAGELTPSLKVKRQAVAEHFAAEVEALFPKR